MWTAPRRRTRGKTRAEVAAVTRGRGSGTTEITRTAARSAAIVPGVSTRFARARQCRRRGRGLVGATCHVAKTLAGPTKNIEDKIDVSFRSSSHAAAPAAANPTTHDGLLGSESRAQQVDAVRASPRRSAQAAHLAGTFVTQSAHFQPAAVALEFDLQARRAAEDQSLSGRRRQRPRRVVRRRGGSGAAPVRPGAAAARDARGRV